MIMDYRIMFSYNEVLVNNYKNALGNKMDC